MSNPVPHALRLRAEASGGQGIDFIDRLPDIVRDCEKRWSIRVGTPFDGGSEAFVAPAVGHDGLESVLKIILPGIDPAHQEIRILRAAQGRGYARLILADEDRNILLVERLGPQLAQLDLSAEEQIQRFCLALHDAWMPSLPGPSLPTGAELACELRRRAETDWTGLGHPCSAAALDLACLCAARRREAFDPEAAVVAHGDPHQWNLLQAGAGFRFVDPDGAFAERAFDLAIPMREWGEALPRFDLFEGGIERSRLLSELTGVEEQPIREWAVLQCVSNGLLALRVGRRRPALVQLAMAEAWARQPGFIL